MQFASAYLPADTVIDQNPPCHAGAVIVAPFDQLFTWNAA